MPLVSLIKHCWNGIFKDDNIQEMATVKLLIPNPYGIPLKGLNYQLKRNSKTEKYKISLKKQYEDRKNLHIKLFCDIIFIWNISILNLTFYLSMMV